jgi:hypothetical protein
MRRDAKIGVVSDDFSTLGPRGFERMCQALAAYVLGPGIEAFGSGPDGGREATFTGRAQYPSLADPWSGFVVVQAKYKEQILGTGTDTTWLRRQVKAELEAWADPSRARVRHGRRPKYLIIATNVPLSGVPGTGGKARINKLIGEYSEVIGIKDWRIWDAAQITTFLNAYPDVRRAFAALITPSEVLAEMRDRLAAPPEVRVVLNVPPAAIRPGQPGVEAAFGEAYTSAGGVARLGQALGEAREEVCGWVQHFDGGPSGEPAVICALYGQPAVAVAGSVWQALSTIGDGNRGGGTAGAGFPVDARPPTMFIGPDSEEIRLAGGSWGGGRLVRGAEGRWEWQPDVAFDSEASRDRDTWAFRDGDMDLRLRVAARIPLVEDGLRITEARRARMLRVLRGADLNDTLRGLAARYGLDADAVQWAEAPDGVGHNNSRFACYRAQVPGTGDRPALAAYLWFMLPGSIIGEISSVADLRIDFGAIKPTSAEPTAVPAELRVIRTELTSFFARAWHVTTAILPLTAMANPLEVPPAGAPRLELHIQNERPATSGKANPRRTLDMVDLSEFGRPRRDPHGDLSVGVTAPLGLAEDKITAIVTDALTRMTEDFGFARPSPSAQDGRDDGR